MRRLGRSSGFAVRPGSSFGSDKARRRFEREIELAARLEHPNIARVYDSGTHHGAYYYAMELIDGLPLDRYVAQKQLSQRDILGLMRRKCPAAFLLVDETYREATYADMPDIPTAVKLDPQIVSVASLSKCHGAPGLRLGWAIARNVALREHLVRAKFNTVVSCSPLDEALALRGLARRTSILHLRRRHLAAGLTLTEEWARRNRELIEWLRPDAGALSCDSRGTSP